MGNALHINGENFDEVVKGQGVALVDFGATWCGPCQALAPKVEELANEYADNDSVRIAKCDVDDASELAGSLGIMSVPTILFYKDGEKVDSMLGDQSKAALKDKIDGLLG